MNTVGTLLRLTSYGESHGESVGAVLDGFPAGFSVDLDAIQAQLDRRKPGQSRLTTARKEEDIFHMTSGLFEGKTTGAPIHLYIKNKDARSSDYDALKDVLRPSHADYSYQAKYGHRDHRGGGRSSARVTAAWVAAGAMAQQWLASKGVKIGAYVQSIGPHTMPQGPVYWGVEAVDASQVRCPDKTSSEKMVAEIEDARTSGDSLGGIVECVITGVQAGWGEPVFGKLNAQLAQAMLSINAVKGISFGGGFEMSQKRGSEVNDSFEQNTSGVSTLTNHSGGIQGGISNGMDITFKLAFKPTASISKSQQTIDRSGNEVHLQTKGRHDPCVVPRAVPIVEAMAALVLMDAALMQSSSRS